MKNGFTFIELIIIVAIAGILAAIIIPQFSSYHDKKYGKERNHYQNICPTCRRTL